MNQVNQLLTSRRGRFSPKPLRIALSISALVHAALVVAVVLVPGLLRSDPPKLDYVEIVSIPAADLNPGPKPQPKVQPAPPAPEPEPEPEPIPEEPVEVPDDIPLIEEKEPEPKPDPPKETPPPVVEPPEEPVEPEEDVDDTPAVPEEPSLPAASKGEVKDTTVAGFDDPDFKYDYYSRSLIAAIQRAWRRPRIDRRLDLAIKFRVSRAGTVSDVELVRTSGIPSYDRAGLRALENASWLPPLPVAYRKQSLGVTVLLP